MSKSREVEFDLSDFSLEEILEHLDSNSNELTKVQKNKLKEIIDDVEEDLTFRELCDDPMYQAATSVSSLNNVMKMEVIVANIDKYTYPQICELFEGKNDSFFMLPKMKNIRITSRKPTPTVVMIHQLSHPNTTGIFPEPMITYERRHRFKTDDE